jgi:hypothetical protein
MSLAVVREHRDFYRKHKWIEFEELIAPQNQERFSEEIKKALSDRLKTPPQKLASISATKRFAAGHDLWRASSLLKKITLGKRLAEVAGELVEIKPLRFGYDQLIFFPPKQEAADPSLKFLDNNPTLQEISSIQNIVCGMMLCIDKLAPADADSESSFFCPTVGNGVVFAPDFPIPFDQLEKREGFTYLLLAYATANAVYCHQEKDPFSYEFKQLGYNFGDRLTEKLNPLVYL